MADESKPVVIVTGSSGYLGSAVVRRLHGSYRVVGLDRYSPPHPPHQAECVCFDITDQASVDTQTGQAGGSEEHATHIGALSLVEDF